MRAKILDLSDLHKRDVDFTTISGYTKAIDAVQEDILAYIASEGITHLIVDGDAYDKGYRSINRFVNDTNYDRLLSDAVNGEAYVIGGNHLYLERDYNPLMYMIQPCPSMPLAKPIKNYKQVYKYVDVLQIGPLQISFFHYVKENKHYIRERNPETTYHVGVYHDTIVIPNSIMQLSNMPGQCTSEILNSVFHNIDFAICHHIHMAIGTIKLPLYGKEIPMCIPGALSITQNKQSEIHDSVSLPLITVDDDGTIAVLRANFSLHLEYMRFFDKKESKAPAALAELTKEKINIGGNIFTAQHKPLTVLLREKGYTDRHLQLINEAYNVGLDPSRAIEILREDIHD